MKKSNYDIILGIVFFGTLTGLGIITIVLSDFALGVEWHRLDLYSEDIGYLRPGDPVLLHGMSAGKVETIERLENAVKIPRPLDLSGNRSGEDVLCTVGIVVKLDIDPYLHLKTDYHITIEDRGLLGGKLIRMEVGENSVYFPKDQKLLAVAPPSALLTASRMLQENRAAVMEAIENIAEFAEKANDGNGTLGLLLTDEVTREQIDTLIDDFAAVGDNLTGGEGTLGKLLTDSAPFDDIKVASSDLRGFTDRIKRGEGSFGKFIQDDAVYEDIRTLAADAREGLSGVWDGDGTLAKLINEDTLYTEATSLVGDLREMAATATNGDGTIAQLLNDRVLYDQVVTLVDDASAVFTDIRTGDGLVAALIHDEKLLDDFRAILNQVLGAIEDARETTPVTSLGSFLFGTF